MPPRRYNPHADRDPQRDPDAGRLPMIDPALLAVLIGLVLFLVWAWMAFG